MWLECFVLPLHAWSHSNLCKIGEVWGCVIGFDENIEKELSFRSARILTVTCIRQFIKGWNYLSLGDKGCDVFMKELGFDFPFVPGYSFTSDVLKINELARGSPCSSVYRSKEVGKLENHVMVNDGEVNDFESEHVVERCAHDFLGTRGLGGTNIGESKCMDNVLIIDEVFDDRGSATKCLYADRCT